MPAGLGGFDAQGVWQNGESDTGALWSDRMNNTAASVSTQFAADRVRLAALESAAPHEGLTRLIPTTPVGTGVTIASGGKVTLGTAITSFSVTLPSTYENILIKGKMKCSVTGTTYGVRFRTAATDLSSSTYLRNGWEQAAAGTLTRVSTGGDTMAYAGRAGLGFSPLELFINGLFLADATNVFMPNLLDDVGMLYSHSARNATATAHSGLTFLTGSATTFSVGCVLRFYGYNNG